MNVGDVIARVETDAQMTTEEEALPATDTPEGIPAAEPESKTTATAPPPSPQAPTERDIEQSTATDRPPAPAAPSIRRLARELGVEPSLESVRLYERIRDGRLDTGAGKFAFHIDGFYRDADDYEIPGYAESSYQRALEEAIDVDASRSPCRVVPKRWIEYGE